MVKTGFGRTPILPTWINSEPLLNEQEKKKGNEEERLNALVRERVEEFEQKREEKEIARMQEYQRSLEE